MAEKSLTELKEELHKLEIKEKLKKFKPEKKGTFKKNIQRADQINSGASLAKLQKEKEEALGKVKQKGIWGAFKRMTVGANYNYNINQLKRAEREKNELSRLPTTKSLLEKRREISKIRAEEQNERMRNNITMEKLGASSRLGIAPRNVDFSSPVVQHKPISYEDIFK